MGIHTALDGIDAYVTFRSRFDATPIVAVQWTMPPGRTLALRDDRLRLGSLDPDRAVQVAFPSVVGRVPVRQDGRITVFGQRSFPAGALLSGPTDVSWDPWTYRLEVQVDDALPDEAWVALPPATVDGRDGLFPPVRFERRWQIAFARICGVT